MRPGVLTTLRQDCDSEADYELSLTKVPSYGETLLPRTDEAHEMSSRVQELIQYVENAHADFEKLVEFREKTLVEDLAPYVEKALAKKELDKKEQLRKAQD